MPEIEIVSRELIVARGVIINYDLTPAEAFKLLPEYNDQMVKLIPLPIWNGGKSGQRLVDIRLVWPQEYVSTLDGRLLIKEAGFINDLPVEVAALVDLRQQLWNAGIYWVAALQESDDQLWRGPDGRRRVFCLHCFPDYPGFDFYWTDRVWFPYDAFAGLPQADA